MKRLMIVIACLFVVVIASAQEQKYNLATAPDSIKKFDAKYSVGTSFSTDLKSGTAFSSYFATNLNYSFSDKLKLELMPAFSSSTFSNYKLWSLGAYSATLNDKVNFLSLNGRAHYDISSKTYIGSTLSFEQNVNHLTGLTGSPMQNMNYQSFNVFMGHQFSPNFKVEVGIGVNHYNNPFYMDAFPEMHRSW
ncbi:MAG: hypothetical protein Q8859_01325 [Bacteroidota bacterium]|nr:hypothetical protein [Bacteroidota bacterium]